VARHRLHVVPRLRGIGHHLLLPDWLAITIGRDVWTWRPLTKAELEHELEHVRQWRRHGVVFIARYAGASLRARRGGGHWYRDNAYEIAARQAAATMAAAPDRVG
jgi:hypothetical protein